MNPDIDLPRLDTVICTLIFKLFILCLGFCVDNLLCIILTKMAEMAIERRQSHLFLNNISAVTNTYDELVKTKLEAGQFPTTITGIIQMVGMLDLLFSLSFFLANSNTLCENSSEWYSYLFPVSISCTLGVQIFLYIIFSVGFTVRRPGFWIYLDICLMLFLSIVTIISSAITYMECNKNGSAFQIPGPGGMAGGVILIVSCGSIFLLYRYVEDEAPTVSTPKENDDIHRKSIFA